MLTTCVSVRAWLCACFQYLHTRTTLLWVIMQQAVVVSYRPLIIGPIGCPEISVINYHYSLRNDSEEHSSHLLRGGSLNSRNFIRIYKCLRTMSFLSTVVTIILIIPTESLY